MKKAHKNTPRKIGYTSTESHFKLELNGSKGDLNIQGNTNVIAGRIASMMLQIPELAPILLKATDTFLDVLEKQEQNNPKTEKEAN